MTKLQKDLIKQLVELAHRDHYYSEDSFYTCPKHEEGCSNDNIDHNKCDCGADDINMKIDYIANKLLLGVE